MRRTPRHASPAAALALAALFAMPAAADVQITQRTVSEGLGGFGDGTNVSTQWIAADKARSEDEFTYTGRFKTLVGREPKSSVSITRLDRGLIWTLEPEKKLYTEMTFEDMARLMREGLAGAEAQVAEAEGRGAPQDAGMTFTVDVKKTGAKQEINGFACGQVLITCVGRPEKTAEGAEHSEVRLVMDQWLTPSLPGQDEVQAFYRRMAEKLGVDEEMRRMGPMAARMYGNAMKAMAEELKDVKGFPVRSTFTIEGPPPAAGDPQAGAERKRAMEDAEKEPEGSDVAEAAKSGSIAGALGGFLGRKAGKAAAKKAAGEPKEPGGPLFKSVTELMSVSTGAAPAGAFDVPAGFKRVKRDDR